jgi:predicted metalloendopeptidase
MKNRTVNKKRTTHNKSVKKTNCRMFASFEGPKYDKPTNQDLIKLLNTPFAPKLVEANNDYYTYINNEWIEKTSKQLKKQNGKFYVQVDDFRITQEKVYYELIELVKNYTKKIKSRRSTLLNNFYKSFVSLNPNSRKNHVDGYVKKLDASIQKGDLWEHIAHINKNEVISWGCPIFWSVNPDEKNSKIYANYISSPDITLYDWQLYDPDEGQKPDYIKYKNIVLNRYFKYIKDIFHACLPNDKTLDPMHVFQAENDILDAINCHDKKIKDSTDSYNKITTKQALTELGFDWATLSKKIGFNKSSDSFVTNNPNYLKCICKKLKSEWKTPKWRTYLLFIFLRQIIRFDKNLRDIYFDFNGRFLKGFTKKFPEEIYPIFGLSVAFNTFLTNEYVDKNWNEENINYVKNMGQDLLTVFKRIIKRNSWLSPKAKSFALKKLDYMKLTVGQPAKLRYDPLLNYTENDAYGNMIKYTDWRTEKFINLVGKHVVDIPVVDWNEFKLVGTQAYIVNAFYQMDKNEIYIPLAYLQKPFIDLDERGIEYNLTRIGYTLGHEMSHSLDDLGSKYDHLGNLHDWWTESDKKKYQKIIDDIVQQYEAFAARDGIHFDASIATGENMADISGLAICEEYLRDFQDKNEDIIPIRSLSFQAFFVYFAIQQRQQISEKAIKAQLKTNPHPLDKYRTNCPLARSKLFRSIYNVKKSDDMWWKTTNTVWN